jgi:hypothetical protein
MLMHPHLLLDATTDKRKKRTVVYAAEPPVSLRQYLHFCTSKASKLSKKRTVVYAAEPPVSLKVSVFALLYE